MGELKTYPPKIRKVKDGFFFQKTHYCEYCRVGLIFPEAHNNWHHNGTAGVER